MRVRDLFRQQGDNRISADVGASSSDLAVRVEHDTPGLRIAPSEAWLPQIGLVRGIRESLAFGEFLTGHAADEPSITAKQLGQAFERSRADSLARHRLDMISPSTLAP